MPDEPINLSEGDTQTPDDAPINLTPETGNKVDVDVADRRAEKFSYGLGADSPGKDVLKFSITNGTEYRARQDAVLNESIKQKQLRLQLGQDYLLNTPAEYQTPGTLEKVLRLSDPAATEASLNPASFFERQYSQRVITTGLTSKDNEIVNNSNREDPNQTDQILERGDQVLTRKEKAQQIHEELEKELKTMGWVPWTWDLAENFIPGFSAYNQTNVMAKGPGGFDNLFLGANKRAQALAYYTEPDDNKAELMLRSAISAIKQHNMRDAMAFSAFMAGATNIDQFMDSAMSIADVGILGEMSFKAGLKLAGKGVAEELTKATKDIIKAAGTRNTTPEQVLEGAGDLANSSLTLAVKQIEAKADATARSSSMDKLKGELYTITNPRDIVTGAEQTLSTTGARKMVDFLEKNATNLVDGIYNKPIDIELAAKNSLTMRTAQEEALEVWKRQSTTAADAILNIEPRKFSVEDKALQQVLAGLDASKAELMRDVQRSNKMQDYINYVFHLDEYEKAVAAGAKAPVKSPGSPTQGSKAGYWRNAAENVAKQEIDDATKERMLKALSFFEGLSKSDKRLFNSIVKADKELANAPKLPPATPNVRLVKDQGNVSYLGIKVGRQARALPNMTEEAVLKLGNAHEATLFDSPNQAKWWANNVYKLPEYNVGQQGTGFYIEVFKPLDFTAPTVRNALAIETLSNNTPGQISSLTKYWRGPEYMFPREVMSDRALAAFGVSNQGKVVANALQELNKLPGALSPRRLLREDSRKDFTKFISYQRTERVAGSDMPGKFSANYAEFEKDYQRVIGRLPTEQEGRAYWSYVQLSNAEFGVTNLRIYSAKARLGWENHSFGKMASGVETPFLEGKFLKDGVPMSLREDAGVIVMKDGEFEFIRTNGGGKRNLGGDRGFAVATKADNRAYLEKLHDQGYKTVQFHQFAERDLRAWAAKNSIDLPAGELNFFMSKSTQSKPLGYLHIPNRAGGHHAYTAEFYTRQPKIRHMPDANDPAAINTKYYGDYNVAGHETYKEAVKHTKSFEKSRELYLDYKMGKANAEKIMDAHARDNLPYSGKAMRELFDKGHFDPHTPFYTTPRDLTVDRAHKLSGKYTEGRFTRASDSELDMFKDVDLKNALERGDTLQSIAATGSKEGPQFKFEPAKMLDALPTLERMAGSVMRGRYIEDLKWKEAQRFIAEFGDMLSATDKQMWDNPLRFLYEAPWRKNVGEDLPRLNAAKAYQRAALEFLNTRSAYETDKRYIQNIAVDTFISKADKVATRILDPWNSHAEVSVAQKLKNAVFHASMSFNPSQFFKQASTLATIAGMKTFSGSASRVPQMFPSIGALTFMRLFGDTPEMAARMGKMVEKATLGTTKAGHFEEMWNSMKRYGFDNVGYERADMAEYMTPNVINGVWGKTLDFGGTPVREGERLTRFGSWTAAYDEWRQANKTAKLSDEAIQAIGNKARIYMGDMVRSSSSAYQNSWAGLATQFMPFNFKLLEQMVDGIKGGGRLTKSEAYGAIATNAILYGIPTGASVFTLGAAGAETARKWALDHGYDPDNFLARMAFYGALNELLRPILGDTNIGERYGPGNMSLIKDVFWGDKSAAMMLMGMSGSYLRDTWYAMDPYRMWISDMFSDSPNLYKPTYEDHKRVLSTLSAGFNNLDKTWMAINTGNYMTKNGVLLDTNMTTMEALAHGILGIDPRRIADINYIRSVNKDEKDLQAKLEPKVRENFVAAVKAFQNDDEANGYMYHRNMMALIAAGNWSPQERAPLMLRIMKGTEADVDEVSRKFAMKSSDRMKAFLKRINKE